MLKHPILAPLFCGGAILQAAKPVTIFGWGPSGALVHVSLGNQAHETVIPASGKWQVGFDAFPYRLKTQLTMQSGDTQVTEDVQFGDVYLLAGQSNIEYKMRDDAEFKEEQANFSAQNIRVYYTPQVEYEKELTFGWGDVVKPAWAPLTKQNLGDVSAVGYYALNKIAHTTPDIPIGMLQCYKGGTSASSWISEAALVADDALAKAYIDPYHRAIDGKTQADFDQADQAYNTVLDAYNTKKAAYIQAHPELSLEAVKAHVGHTPWPPPMRPESYLRPNGLFHTMVEKTAPYTVKAMVWYQGENDADHAALYEKLLTRLIIQWRSTFQQSSLPVYLVQLPQYQDEPHHAWAMIRQAQVTVSRQLEDIHLVSLVDTGEHHNIHPVHKRTAGSRLGSLILSQGRTPSVAAVSRAGDKITVTIDPATRLEDRGGAPVEGLLDGKWVPLQSTLHGNRLVITDTGHVRKIRYAYRNAPTPAYFNEDGYPLSPFLLNISEVE
ncbi:sialate O-acetylesterase [Lacticaseibacillus jixianensis]|uniref:Sialate O-acetylesterase n=1 Tax=Lacticaseibacillus jixianensis TaxID=2486012 RepID=A0ABW4BD10_9LACO|nr:sialate O-acetylesterase [Lacticaseibacillus jixianensis]